MPFFVEVVLKHDSISKHLWNFFFLWEIFRVVLVLLQCAPIILFFSSDEATRKKTYKSENLGTCVSLSSIQISRKKTFFTLELCVLLWKPFYTLRLYWYHTFIWPLNLTFDSEYLFRLNNESAFISCDFRSELKKIMSEQIKKKFFTFEYNNLIWLLKYQEHFLVLRVPDDMIG